MKIHPRMHLISGAGIALLLSVGAAFASDLTVGIDQTRTVRLTSPITTISVGNPAIADVSLENGTMFVLGRSFGRTNILGLDAKGDTVLDLNVSVTQPNEGNVTVYRGTRQASYNCAPNCERALMPGDGKDEYDQLSNQVSNKMSVNASAKNN